MNALAKILVAIASAAAVFAFICRARELRHSRAAAEWLEANRPEAWQRLPWTYRHLARPTVAARLLHEAGVLSDAELEQIASPIRRLVRYEIASLAVAAACIALLFLATHVSS